MKILDTIDLPDVVPINDAARLLEVTPRTVRAYLSTYDRRLDGPRDRLQRFTGVYQESLLAYLSTRHEGQKVNRPGGMNAHRPDTCPRCGILSPAGHICRDCRRETRGLPYYYLRETT